LQAVCFRVALLP